MIIRNLNFFVWLVVGTLTTRAQQLPIKPTRNIEFVVTEGSCMNVNPSPDGKMLAFDLLGDIYLLPISGGTAIQLTKGVALHLNPVWSPDSKFIAYQCDSTGTMKTHIRNIENGNIEIKEMVYKDPFRRLSTLLTNVKLPGGVPKDANCISSDGKWVAWQQAKQRKEKGIGKKQGRTSLYLMNTQRGKEKVLVQFLSVQDTSKDYRQNFAFSADNSSIFIGYGGKIHKVELTGEDKVVPFEARVSVSCGPLAYHTFKLKQNDFNTKYIRNASISPNGKKLVFSAMNKIYTMEIPKGTPKILATQNINQYQPVWSPDGNWIVYVTWDDKDGGSLWLTNARNGQQKKLADISGQYQNPCFSQDGKYIAVIKGEPVLGDRDDAGKGSLLLISLIDGKQRILDTDVQLWNKLSFSRNGKAIYYVPYIPGSKPQTQVLISKSLVSDSIEVLITDKQQRPRHLTGCSLSPDGNYLIYSQGDDVMLLKANKTTTKTELFDNGLPKAAIRFAAGVDPIWSSDGKMICWVFANQFHSASLAEIAKLIPAKGIVTSIVKPEKSLAVNLTVPSMIGTGTIALTNAKIITMGAWEVIENGTLVIKDGKILTIGKRGKPNIPKNAKVIDLAGKTIMPGLIDLHCHIGVPSNVFPQQSWMMLANLAYGVTTARDPSQNYDSFGYAELLRSGHMLGPRLITVGRAVRMAEGSYDGTVSMDSQSDVQHTINKRKQMGGISIKQYGLKTRLQRQWTLLASDKAGLNMTNEGDRDLIGQIAMIKDGSPGIEHNPEWGDVYDDVIQFYAKSETYLTPALQVGYGIEPAKEFFKYKYWHEEDVKLERFTYSDPTQTIARPTTNGAETLETIRMSIPKDSIQPGFLSTAKIDYGIFKSGGKIGVGSHGNNEGIGMHNEIWALQMGGMSNTEVLQAATIVGAQALGLQADLGSLEPGKIADLLILEKNPLEDIHNTREIRYVMKDGVLYDGNTLETLWPKRRPAPKWR